MKWAYTYANGRLASVTKNGTLLASYGWDANGNRAGSAVDDQDRLVMQGDANWTYDVMGHLKTRTDSRGSWTFTYDALWNLLSATGPQNISYVVDARGRRVGRKVNGALVQGFLYSGQLNVVAELDGSSNVVSRFVYGTRANVPDYMIKAGVKYKLITDHLGSVRLVVNTSTGAVVSRIEYNVWGEITLSQNLSFQPFGFAGGLRDDATGLVRFGARDYDPHVGRWTAKDPIGFNGGEGGLYGYSFQDPVNYLDPFGQLAVVFVTMNGTSATHTGMYINNKNGAALWNPGGSFPGEAGSDYVYLNNPDIPGDQNASIIRYIKFDKLSGESTELYQIPATLAQEEEMRNEMGGGSPGTCAYQVSSLLNEVGPYKGNFSISFFPSSVRSQMRKLLGYEVVNK